jgi:hypothetical protein
VYDFVGVVWHHACLHYANSGANDCSLPPALLSALAVTLFLLGQPCIWGIWFLTPPLLPFAMYLQLGEVFAGPKVAEDEYARVQAMLKSLGLQVEGPLHGNY